MWRKVLFFFLALHLGSMLLNPVGSGPSLEDRVKILESDMKLVKDRIGLGPTGLPEGLQNKPPGYKIPKEHYRGK